MDIEKIKAERDLYKLALMEITTHPEEDAIGIAEAALLLAEQDDDKLKLKLVKSTT